MNKTKEPVSHYRLNLFTHKTLNMSDRTNTKQGKDTENSTHHANERAVSITEAAQYFKLDEEKIEEFIESGKLEKHKDDKKKVTYSSVISLFEKIHEQEKVSVFWSGESDKDGKVKICKINPLKFIQFLHKKGFRRLDLEQDFTFIRITKNLIKEVTITEIQDFVISYIEEAFIKETPKDAEQDISKDMVLNAFYRSPQTYFSKYKLSLLGTESITVNQDSSDTGYFYFRNGYIEVTKAGIHLHDYSKLKHYVWLDQVIDRDFNLMTNEICDFQQFTLNISGKKESRFLSFRTIIGYLLHSYFDYPLRAVNLTDSKISDFDEGRTGKTLLSRAIGKVRNYKEIAGKSFQPENEKKYQEVKLDTQVVHINDARSNLNFELLYNDITDGMRVRKLYQEPFTVRAKMIISSNRPLAVHGSSAKARVIEFELADHYSKEFTPEDEFGQWFFRDWDSALWAAFDAFMVNCLHEFFVHGVIEPEEINLSARKLIKETNKEFVEFMESCFDDDDGVKEPVLKIGQEFDKKSLYNQFISEYEDYGQTARKLTQRKFTDYLKLYALHNKIKFQEHKSGDRRTMTYYKENEAIKSRQHELQL